MGGPDPITIALDTTGLVLSADDAARIEAVDARIRIVRGPRGADAADRADVALTRDGYRFGTESLPPPDAVGAGARAEFAMHALLRFAKRPGDGSAPYDLRDRTLLVIGLGAAGRSTVRLGSAFGMRVLAINRSGSTDCPGVETIRTPVFLGDLLPVAHAVVLALPQNDGTRGLIGPSAIGHLRSDATVVCIGSGTVLDDRVLAAALDEGRPAGAAFDAHAAAGLPADSPLPSARGVLMHPHDAGAGPGVTHRIVQDFLPYLHRYVRGEAVEG